MMPKGKASVWLASFPSAGQALGTDGRVDRKISGFPTADQQQKTNWCWAAVCSSILSVLPRPGQGRTQREVVATVQGAGAVTRDDPEDLGSALGRLGWSYRVLRAANLKYVKFDQNVRLPIKAGHPMAITIVWSSIGAAHAVCAFGYGKLGQEDALLIYDPADDDDPSNNVTLVTVAGMSQYAAQVSGGRQFGAWDAAYIVGEN